MEKTEKTFIQEVRAIFQAWKKTNIPIPPSNPIFDKLSKNKTFQDKLQTETFSNDWRISLDKSIHNTLLISLHNIEEVFMLLMAPLAIFIDLLRFLFGKIDFATLFHAVVEVPLTIFKSIFGLLSSLYKTLFGFLSIISILIGFLAWHIGETASLSIQTNREGKTILSDMHEYRKTVYYSLGLTLLSAMAVFFTSSLPLRLFGLPILVGSLYAILNNLFTITTCPEYYTMGHSYDGKSFRKHLIKTNRLLIKAVITGCYASTIVTIYVGLALALADTLPFAKAPISFSTVNLMIITVSGISLIAAHLRAKKAETTTRKNIEKFAKIMGAKLDQENLKKTWPQFYSAYQEKISLLKNPQKSQVKLLAEKIKLSVLVPDLPLSYIPLWNANSTRNLTGYFFSGIGLIFISTFIVFKRIYFS